MWNISQVQQRGLSPHQFLDLVCDVFQTCREVSLCESLFWWLRISTVKPCIRPEAFSLATIMGEAMQHAGTSHAAGRPSSSATGSGSRAITEVKYQILWFQLHTIPKKKYSTLCHCVFPNSRLLFLSWGAAPAPVHPAPIADPARDREASLIVPARVGSSEESSPGQGCDTEEKPKKKDTRKKDKKDKKKRPKMMMMMIMKRTKNMYPCQGGRMMMMRTTSMT